MRLLLCLALACAACGPRVTGPPSHLCGAAADAPDADAADPGLFAFVCWATGDAGVHCFVGAGAAAACLADPARPPSAHCE